MKIFKIIFSAILFCVVANTHVLNAAKISQRDKKELTRENPNVNWYQFDFNKEVKNLLIDAVKHECYPLMNLIFYKYSGYEYIYTDGFSNISGITYKGGYLTTDDIVRAFEVGYNYRHGQKCFLQALRNSGKGGLQLKDLVVHFVQKVKAGYRNYRKYISTLFDDSFIGLGKQIIDRLHKRYERVKLPELYLTEKQQNDLLEVLALCGSTMTGYLLKSNIYACEYRSIIIAFQHLIANNNVRVFSKFIESVNCITVNSVFRLNIADYRKLRSQAKSDGIKECFKKIDFIYGKKCSVDDLVSNDFSMSDFTDKIDEKCSIM